MTPTGPGAAAVVSVVCFSIDFPAANLLLRFFAFAITHVLSKTPVAHSGGARSN